MLHSAGAEIAAEYLQKGSFAYVEGRLRTRKWQDKGGRDCYTMEIEATDIQFLGEECSRAEPARQNEEGAPWKTHVANQQANVPIELEDDIRSEITVMAELLMRLIRYVLLDTELSLVLFGTGLTALLGD